MIRLYMEKIQCSVPILTLNSDKYLKRCLESMRDFEDVFLVDGNSIDDTLSVAGEYGIPVYKQVETDEKNIAIKNFSEIRIKSVGLAKRKWIFFLDSDEYITKELADEIRLAIEAANSKKVAFNVQKKYCIGERKFDFAFNYPNYYLRLYRPSQGIGFKPGKMVHEQIQAPDDVEITNLKNCVYSEVSSTYKACVEKDNFQLGLMKESTFTPGAYKGRLHSLKIGCVYFLRAVKILFKSLLVYLRHGYKKSLPIGQVLRHVRVHLIMSYWRFLQFLYGQTS